MTQQYSEGDKEKAEEALALYEWVCMVRQRGGTDEQVFAAVRGLCDTHPIFRELILREATGGNADRPRRRRPVGEKNGLVVDELLLALWAGTTQHLEGLADPFFSSDLLFICTNSPVLREVIMREVVGGNIGPLRRRRRANKSGWRR
jgi:hypothetical protein